MEKIREVEEAYKERPSEENANALRAVTDQLRYGLTSLRVFWAGQIESVDDFLDCEDLPIGQCLSLSTRFYSVGY